MILPTAENPVPVNLPDYLERARLTASAAKKIFRNKTELVTYLNTNSGGKFVAVVFRDKVVIGPGTRHPEDVLADYVNTHPELAVMMEIPAPSELNSSQREPLEGEQVGEEVPQELGDFLKTSSGELTASDPSDELKPGTPPRFRPSKTMTGAGPIS